MADFLVALADFDRRRGWEPLGHASLFAFLLVELRLSKGAAWVRSSAARLIQSHPEAIEPLRDGRLCLSSVGELARVATTENFAAVLPRFFGCSSREAREVAAAIQPHQAPPVRDQVTRLATVVKARSPFEAPAAELSAAPSPAHVAAALEPGVVDFESVRAHEPALPHPARDAATLDDVEPLTADLRRLHVTVSRRVLGKLDAARDGLGHSIPGASTEQVIEAALDLLLEKQARARGQVKRPRTALATEATLATVDLAIDSKQPSVAAPSFEAPVHRRTGPREAIPAAVRRAVWQRDGGRCAWPLDAGGCCGSTQRLELDHVVPWARGGETTVANLRVVCHRHNAAAARQAFGERTAGRYARSAASS